MIYIIATIFIKPGSLEQVLPLAKTCIDATRQEEGCLSYDLHQSVTDENTLVFVERWKDQDAINVHFMEPHLTAWIEAGKPFITGKKVEIITPQEVKEI